MPMVLETSFPKARCESRDEKQPGGRTDITKRGSTEGNDAPQHRRKEG